MQRMSYPEVREELETVWEKAKPHMAPKCRCCRECNSINCRRVESERAKTAERNYRKLQQIKIITDTLYDGGDGSEIDSSIELFGKIFRAPISSAPFGNVKNFNPNTRFQSDYFFNKALIDGVSDAGCLGWTGDTIDAPGESVYEGPLRAIAERNGLGIPAIKAWNKEEMQKKIILADKAGCIAIANDIDCVGLPYLSVNGKGKVYPKTPEAINDIFSITKTPYILKGIMSAKGAEKALESGASGIVVSNHAGNVLDQALATIEVLAEIKRVVGNEMIIFVDGGVRHGEDVFKMLALGADAVMIGRTYIIAAEGGEARGVELYTQKICWELQNAMRMTGCRTLKDITKDKIFITREF